jgi:hypothetical protein
VCARERKNGQERQQEKKKAEKRREKKAGVEVVPQGRDD